MSRRHIIMLVAATALAGPLLLAPTQTTGAYWSKQVGTEELLDTRSDIFSMTANSFPSEVDHSQANTTVVSNAPEVSIKNNSTTHSSWIDVVSTEVTVRTSKPVSVLMEYTNLDYAVSAVDGHCTTALSGPGWVPGGGFPAGVYWDVKGGVNDAKPNTRYDRTPTPPGGTPVQGPGGELGPGETKAVCPWVRPVENDNFSTVEGRRNFLIVHAGRQLKIATTLRQRSFGAGTWTSNQTVVNTPYQVKLPPPTRPNVSDNRVCAKDGLWGRLYWAWPFAGDYNNLGSPAIDRFELIRSTDGVNWSPFRKSINQSSGAVYRVPGEDRRSEPISGLYVTGDNAAPVYLSVRAFLYEPDSAVQVHVDADWMVKANRGKSGVLIQSRWFNCWAEGSAVDSSSGVQNDNSGPVGLD